MKAYHHLRGNGMHARLLAIGAVLAGMFAASCTMNQLRHQLDGTQLPAPRKLKWSLVMERTLNSWAPLPPRPHSNLIWLRTSLSRISTVIL